MRGALVYHQIGKFPNAAAIMFVRNNKQFSLSTQHAMFNLQSPSLMAVIVQHSAESAVALLPSFLILPLEVHRGPIL